MTAAAGAHFIDAHGDFVDSMPARAESYAAHTRKSRYERLAARWLETPAGRAWLLAKKATKAEEGAESA